MEAPPSPLSSRATPRDLLCAYTPNEGPTNELANPAQAVCSLGAQPRDLRFRGPLLEMFFRHRLAHDCHPVGQDVPRSADRSISHTYQEYVPSCPRNSRLSTKLRLLPTRSKAKRTPWWCGRTKHRLNRSAGHFTAHWRSAPTRIWPRSQRSDDLPAKCR